MAPIVLVGSLPRPPFRQTREWKGAYGRCPALILLKAQSLASGRSVFARVIHQRVKLYVYTYTYMGSKTISITEDAYHRLRARKRRGESFTDVILRLTERRPLSEFAGVLDEETGRALVAALEEARRERASVDVSR